jgi:multicomponent Na+:H+ antiporter subunit D
MNQLLPLSVVLPLLVAAAISALGWVLRPRRRLLDLIAIATSLTSVVLLALILAGSAQHDLVYWFGGFRPHHGIAIGIDFEVSPVSAALATLAAVLVTAAMIFSWRYFDEVATYYHALMLAFLAAMTGFCLTGDIFDLFVWFELMSVAAYALTAYRPEERGPLQGALNFAISNSIGAYLTLSGIALIYARTGALNMAQIGADLAGRRPDGLVVVAFLLVISGFLIKSAIVPFHFWLADAHAVAPTPVCVLFSGVMVELGLYAIARVYWSVFGAALGHHAAITAVLETLGLVTALTGALFCFRERHIKRLLAFSTISHSGLFLTGIALLTPLALAGAAAYVNESWLHGRGRALRATGVVFTIAALALADLPVSAGFLGKAWIEQSASARGATWITVIFILASVLVGGAVLRVAGGVFFGLGDPPGEDPQMAAGADEETSETGSSGGRTPLTMVIPAAVLTAGGLVVTVLPGFGRAVVLAALRFQDQAGYNAAVLAGASLQHGARLTAGQVPGVGLAAVAVALGSVAGSVLLAWLALYWRRLPVLRRVIRPSETAVRLSQGFQSGVMNDYAAWIVFGLAAVGGALAFAIR